MGIDTLVISSSYKPEELDSIVMASLFLSSDFDISTIKKVYRASGLSIPTGAKKSRLVDVLAARCEQSSHVREKVIQSLLLRNHGWLTFKKGTFSKLPRLSDASELVISIGEEKWYGPVSSPEDVYANWYIRPVFLTHWETSSDRTAPQQSIIRWLCFVRVSGATTSLHWRGFSYADTVDKAQNKNVQFAYWQRVPTIFDEFQELADVKLYEVDLHKIILHELWDAYRYNEDYSWIDRRIRAESGGVSLNARAGHIQELSIKGIRGLANTIRCSIESELAKTYGHGLPDGQAVDEVILRTLLREFGTLSYEFSLEKINGERFFRAHTYFGQRNHFDGPDCFPHLNVFTTWQSDLSLLHFLLRYTSMSDGSERRIAQASLFG
jgi:hypothetical protein